MLLKKNGITLLCEIELLLDGELLLLKTEHQRNELGLRNLKKGRGSRRWLSALET